MKEKQILKYFTTKAKVSIIKQPTCMERNWTKVEFKKDSSAVLLRASGGNTLTHTHKDLTLFFHIRSVKENPVCFIDKLIA